MTDDLQSILQISTAEKSGGAARIAWYLHQAYQRRGLQSWMAVGRKETDDPDIFEIPNNKARSFPTRALLRACNLLDALERRILRTVVFASISRGIADPMRYLNIYRGVEDFRFPGTWQTLDLIPQRPTIIHCHNLHGNYFDLRALPWLCEQLPVVLTLHDTWLLSGHCAYAMACERWRTGCGDCPDLSIYPAIRRDATAYNWHRKKEIYSKSRLYITAPSNWLMKQVEQSILAPAIVEARVIHNGVDLSLFRQADKKTARAALGLPNDATVLLFVGQGAHRNQFKDYTTMENAVRGVASRSDGDNVLFLCLGGEGTERSFGKARIRFVSYEKELAKVARFYQAADMYLHAAHADTFPNTVIEALACGTPVVATAVGGIPEQIEEGVTGFLTPRGDAEAMAARIAQLLADEELRRKMGAKAAEVARERFNLDRQVDEHLEWFADIVATWQPPGPEG